MRLNTFKSSTHPPRSRKWGFSLIELLCVIVVIGILAAMYFGVIAKVFVGIKHFLGGFSN